MKRTPKKYKLSVVCTFFTSEGHNWVLKKCPYRYKCWKHDEFDPSAKVMALDFEKCKLYRRFKKKEEKNK